MNCLGKEVSGSPCPGCPAALPAEDTSAEFQAPQQRHSCRTNAGSRAWASFWRSSRAPPGRPSRTAPSLGDRVPLRWSHCRWRRCGRKAFEENPSVLSPTICQPYHRISSFYVMFMRNPRSHDALTAQGAGESPTRSWNESAAGGMDRGLARLEGRHLARLLSPSHLFPHHVAITMLHHVMSCHVMPQPCHIFQAVSGAVGPIHLDTASVVGTLVCP